jgi:hypothetical protein
MGLPDDAFAERFQMTDQGRLADAGTAGEEEEIRLMDQGLN